MLLMGYSAAVHGAAQRVAAGDGASCLASFNAFFAGNQRAVLAGGPCGFGPSSRIAMVIS
jgi:hypothetical protein